MQVQSNSSASNLSPAARLIVKMVAELRLRTTVGNAQFDPIGMKNIGTIHSVADGIDNAQDLDRTVDIYSHDRGFFHLRGSSR